MPRKARWTFEQHQEVGLELSRMRNRLVPIQVRVGNSFDRKIEIKLARSLAWLDEVRSDLEGQMFRDFRGSKTTDELLAVYYGRKWQEE